MNFYRNNWYYVGLIIFVALAFWMALFGETVDPLRRIMIVAFMALLIHEFEEYALPGGFPMIMNMTFFNERKVPERYPLNTKSAFVCNVVLVYPLYIASIVFSDCYLLGLITMYFGIAQIFVHGIVFNLRLKSFYNPGVATTIFLLIPIGIYYIWYLAQNYQVPTWNWWVALLIMPLAGVFLLALPIKLMKNKQSPYAFSEDEVKRFSVKEKMGKV